MADPEFEEFRVSSDKMPQYIKATPHCYRIAHDLELMCDGTQLECYSGMSQVSLEQTDNSHLTQFEDGELSDAKPPWLPSPPGDMQPKQERKRRKLPEIPKDKRRGRKKLSAMPASLAEELQAANKHEAEAVDGHEIAIGQDNSLQKRRLIHRVSNSMFLEIDRTDGLVKPLLSCHTKEKVLTENDFSPEFDGHGRFSNEIDSGTSTAHTPSVSPVVNGSVSHSSSSTLSSTPSGGHLQLQDATHRGLQKFIPRHEDEIEVEIGDPVYIQREADDLWCEGVNLRTGTCGIFPSAYVIDIDYSDFDPDGVKTRKERYLVDFLGSCEVSYHKGNQVLCSAVKKVARARASELGIQTPHSCILEISDQGLRMVDRNRPSVNHVPTHDYFFNLKNVTFCGYHPVDHRYFGFITKHPLYQRFACHVFMGEESTRDVAEAVGRAFHRFYHKFIEMAYPIEDIYLE
ncbi:JNK-interacting protein Aplip1 isoform X2 [Tachypleus tridentatus]|uniref:JNK-interacting protein Aplip1 isoform X2 n=1 Tax=Tachypleus tridentatus TaxID=6853 RepID=UPI003FD024AD